MERQLSNEPAGARFTSRNYRYVIAGLTLLANLAAGLNLFAPAPLFPLIIEDYSINRAAAGLIVTLTLLMAASFGLPGGVITAWLGLRRAFMAGWLLLSLLVVSTWIPNFGSMLVLRATSGLGNVLLVAATGPLLMQWFKPREILMMNGLNSALFSMGIALSVATAAPLSGAVGWPNALSLFGVVPVIGALAWMVLGRPVGSTRPLVPIFSRRALWTVISDRAIVILVAANAGVLFQYTALTSWLPSFYHESRDMSLTQAGFITGLVPFVGIFAVLLGGFLPVRPGSKKLILLASGVMVLLGGPGSFLFGNLAAIYISVVLVGIGSGLYLPTLMSLTIELPGMTPEKVAVVWGFIMTVVGFAMFVSPLVVGGLRDISGSFLPGFTICAVATSSLILAAIFMPATALRPVRYRYQD